VYQQTLFQTPPPVNRYSPIQTLLAQALREIPCPPFEQEYVIERYRVDFAIPSARLIVECDGFDYHSTPAQLAADYRRTRRLYLLGWDLIRFTGAEISRDAKKCALEIFEHVWVRKRVSLGMESEAPASIH